MIYVKFNSAGKSVEMTNVKPDSLDYFEVADDLMGLNLIKDETGIRTMTEKEIEESLFSGIVALATIAVKDQALHLLKESEYLALPDSWESYTETQKSVVKAYRDFLKTIEQQPGFPLEVNWPDLPNLKE